VKYDPDRFGKHGFKPPIRREVRVINVGELDEQIESLLGNEQAEKTKEEIKIYLNRLGYDKLLGKGKVSKSILITFYEDNWKIRFDDCNINFA